MPRNCPGRLAPGKLSMCVKSTLLIVNHRYLVIKHGGRLGHRLGQNAEKSGRCRRSPALRRRLRLCPGATQLDNSKRKRFSLRWPPAVAAHLISSRGWPLTKPAYSLPQGSLLDGLGAIEVVPLSTQSCFIKQVACFRCTGLLTVVALRRAFLQQQVPSVSTVSLVPGLSLQGTSLQAQNTTPAANCITRHPSSLACFAQAWKR